MSSSKNKCSVFSFQSYKFHARLKFHFNLKDHVQLEIKIGPEKISPASNDIFFQAEKSQPFSDI